MTREEAIKWTAYVQQSEPWQDRVIEALDMAIEALQTPPISQRSMYQAGYRQGREEALKREPSEDGTLEAKVEDATKIGRVLISDDKHRGGLYYPDEDEPQSVSFENDTKIKSYSKDSDLISREAAKDIAFRSPFFSDALIEELDALPSADRPRGEWTLLTEERPVDNYEIIATVYWPGYGDSTIAVGHIDRFDNWHLYSPTEGELIKGFEVIAWKTLPEPYKEGDTE